MTKQPSSKPAYLAIADALRGRIQRAELRPGDRFPTERALVHEFNVARMTVRHALDILQLEGLIDRRRGRTGGTFVRTTAPVVDLGRVEDLGAQLRNDENELVIDELEESHVQVPPTVAEQLAIAETDRVWSVKRLHTVDGTRALYSHHFVPAADLQGHWEQRRPAKYRQSLEPALPNAMEQKALGLSRTTPILRVQRCALDAAGRPLDFTEMALRGDVAKLHLDI